MATIYSFDATPVRVLLSRMNMPLGHLEVIRFLFSHQSVVDRLVQ
jgi:hypothetical protein